MKTRVIFRTFKPRPEFQEAGGDVIAVFPELPARLEWLKGKAAKDNTVSIQRKESTNEQ